MKFQAKHYEIFFLSIRLNFVSFAVSLYSKVVSILSLLIIYRIFKLCKGRTFRRKPQQMEIVTDQFYKVFTWLGIYLQNMHTYLRLSLFKRA